MSNNLFGPSSKDDIRVGYISTDTGYVTDITICEANTYAQKNPGTTFIFRNGNNNIQYLNVNEVNKLTPNDIVSTANTCGGLQATTECGPPKVQFFGGGGVGAVGNPIVGIDGSILAVDLVSGGFGYQYPPITQVKDSCQIGNGAVLTAVLGETQSTEETFEGEGDFEDYEICANTDVGYGTNWGPNGEDLGPWDPKIYTDPGEDPIQVEIEKYQERISKTKNPFWTTRKNTPKRITSLNNSFKSTEVTFPAWNDFMNSYAISPVSPSNVPGSDYAGRVFTFEWEENFPYTGEYIFRGLCDNVAKLYIDNNEFFELGSFQDAVNAKQKTLTAGVHNIRLDLLNVPIIETKAVQTSAPINGWNGPGIYLDLRNVDKDTTVNFRTVANDSSVFHGVDIPDIGVLNENNTKGKGKDIELKGGRIYGPCKPTATDKSGVRIYVGNEKVKDVKNSGSRPVTQLVLEERRDDWNDYVILTSIGQWTRIDEQPPTKSVVTSTPSAIKNVNIFNTVDYIGKANRTLWRTNPTASATSRVLDRYGICPFDTTTAEAQKQSYAGTHTIIWNNINFPIDGDYRIQIGVDDNVTLYIGDTQIVHKGFYAPGKGNPDLNELYNFKAGNYTIRAELEQINVGPISKGNPMVLAVNIETAYSTVEVVSPKSWNENPMGVSLMIDAPPPPIPQEKPPVQEGRCPPSPLWSTRFPGAKNQWYPVRFKGWSKFFNRYALSPVPPSDNLGSDSGGVTFENSWDVVIPYNGYYKIQGEVDDIAKIYVDGSLSLDLSRRVGKTNGSKKVYLAKGDHKIKVEVENYQSEVYQSVERKIFSTQDWIVASSSQPKTIDVNFNVSVTGQFENKFTIDDLGITVSKVNDNGQSSKKENITKNVEYGRAYKVKLSTSKKGQIKLRTKGDTVLQAEDHTDYNWKDIQCTTSIGRFYDLNGDECKFVVDDVNLFPTTASGTAKNGVTYSGPTLFHYDTNTWASDFMRKYSISPKVFNTIDAPDEKINGIFNLTWTGVKFPEDGQYDIKFQADNIGVLRIGGREIKRTTEFSEQVEIYRVNITAGTYDVSIELTNIQDRTNIFTDNPVGTALYISKIVSVLSSSGKPWTENPIGVSAILIPPPCPKLTGGKGVVKQVVVQDPGVGYPLPVPVDQGYPVVLKLAEVIVENSGINYNCGVDQLQISPDTGCQLSYTCDSFGRIKDVTVNGGCSGFTFTPEITLPSDTGVNASFRPVFEVIRDPLDPALTGEGKLIQVTDLVGLKQTGYVDGRAYYGAVFYENGVKYAGYYKTIGTPIRIYDTLQESITANVTTPASAIERSGTDVTSNDPRLNIPGTPQNLI
jgi:hypothetical protein